MILGGGRWYQTAATLRFTNNVIRAGHRIILFVAIRSESAVELLFGCVFANHRSLRFRTDFSEEALTF